MTAFLTGSRVYGAPTEDSDIDLVVLVDELTQDKLRGWSESPDWSYVVRFGRLNLICVTSEDELAAWRAGTASLRQRVSQTGRPIDREVAKEMMDMIRRTMGLGFFERSPSEEEWAADQEEALAAAQRKAEPEPEPPAARRPRPRYQPPQYPTREPIQQELPWDDDIPF